MALKKAVFVNDPKLNIISVENLRSVIGETDGKDAKTDGKDAKTDQQNTHQTL